MTATVEVPVRMRGLPRDERGYVVPFFVAWQDGQPEFRCADHRKWRQCYECRLCWLCGQGLQSRMTFVLGPMCGLNRTTSEPPCHHECATYAVQACPFLTKPRMRRNEKDLPDHTVEPGGLSIDRNPGTTLLWTTKSYRLFDAGNGELIRIGDPVAVEWWCEGRAATQAEVVGSVLGGLTRLENLAKLQGPRAVDALCDSTVHYFQFIDRCFARTL
jgi:hypothetical protein